MGEFYSCPRISSEFMDCSLPLTADTSSLCTFDCAYCFANYQKSNNPSLKGENLYTKPIRFESFKDMMTGKNPENPYYKNFIKHRFPLHFGGLSDAFDNYEEKHKVTLKVLILLVELNYPTIFSTKGTCMAYGEYYEVLKKAAPNKNFIFQFSIITNNNKKAEVIDRGCPPVEERFKAMKIISDLGYWTVLRLRPFIIGASDDGMDDFFKKASESGARALSTEFYCYDDRVDEKGKEKYKELSKVLGYNIIDFYKKLSPSECGGYRRLNRDVKEKYIKQMWLLCKKYNMQFNISDPDFKELNQSGSCCGIPESKEIYNSDCVNWSRGQITYFLTLLLKRYLNGEKDLYLTVDEILSKAANNWINEPKFYGDSLKNWDSVVQNKGMNYGKEFTQTWNRLSSPGNPYNYFHGLLKPHHLDDNKNIVYEFNPPLYIKKWKKEGIL